VNFQAQIPQLPPVVPSERPARCSGGGSSKGAAPPQLRPLRVGYISPDLFVHSVSYFAEALLSAHSPGAVSLYVYDATPRRDAKSQRLRQRAEVAGGVWRCVDDMSDEQVAGLVREDAIDILVELTGGWVNGGAGTGPLNVAAKGCGIKIK
jgi:protein O-GlcNAc transferase